LIDALKRGENSASAEELAEAARKNATEQANAATRAATESQQALQQEIAGAELAAKAQRQVIISQSHMTDRERTEAAARTEAQRKYNELETSTTQSPVYDGGGIIRSSTSPFNLRDRVDHLQARLEALDHKEAWQATATGPTYGGRIMRDPTNLFNLRDRIDALQKRVEALEHNSIKSSRRGEELSPLDQANAARHAAFQREFEHDNESQPRAYGGGIIRDSTSPFTLRDRLDELEARVAQVELGHRR
jgi:hypothetical protein